MIRNAANTMHTVKHLPAALREVEVRRGRTSVVSTSHNFSRASDKVLNSISAISSATYFPAEGREVRRRGVATSPLIWKFHSKMLCLARCVLSSLQRFLHVIYATVPVPYPVPSSRRAQPVTAAAACMRHAIPSLDNSPVCALAPSATVAGKYRKRNVQNAKVTA